MSTKYTPGPWLSLVKGTEYSVSSETGYITHALAQPQRRSVAETQANARLIATAPELLETLKRVVARLPKELTLDGETFRDEMIDLIAKATGGAE